MHFSEICHFAFCFCHFPKKNSLNACLSHVKKYLDTFTSVQDRRASSTSAADIKYATTTSDCEQTVLCVIIRGMVPSRGDSCVSAVCLYMGATSSGIKKYQWVNTIVFICMARTRLSVKVGL